MQLFRIGAHRGRQGPGRSSSSPNGDRHRVHPNQNPTVSCRVRRKEAASMQRKLAAILTLLALAATAPLLTACYTTQGAGQDLQAAGRGLERSADRNTNYRP